MTTASETKMLRPLGLTKSVGRIGELEDDGDASRGAMTIWPGVPRTRTAGEITPKASEFNRSKASVGLSGTAQGTQPAKQQ